MWKKFPCVNFTNILRATFAPIYVCKIIASLIFKSTSISLYKEAIVKLMMKLTPLLNLINTLQAAFSQIFFCQKITNSNWKNTEAAQNAVVQISCS